MKYFILEDDPYRISIFEQQLEDEDYFITEDVDEAKKMLTDNKYDLILLDHDLGGQAFVPSDDPNTGYQVALHIPTTQNRTTRVIVHSWNPVGAKNICAALKDSENEVIEARFGTFFLGSNI